MANLSSLVHELRERIAAPSTPPNNRYDDDLVTRFRAALPDLLHASVVPSPSANEREVIAVLKLIVITARHLPGVFHHGKATAILPLLGRILPFLAEPSFRCYLLKFVCFVFCCLLSFFFMMMPRPIEPLRYRSSLLTRLKCSMVGECINWLIRFMTFKNKRQKADEDIMSLDSNYQGKCKRTHTVACERENYADYMLKSLLSFVEFVKPPGVHPDSLRPDAALRALSLLCVAFCRYPETNLSLSIFCQMYAWMPWEFQVALDISIYLEGIHSMLLLQRFKNKNVDADLVYVLKLPWTYPHVVPDPHPLWKCKCISVQVSFKLGHITSTKTQLEVQDLGLHDEFEEVIIEAIISMPVIVMWSGIGWLPHVSRRLLFGGERSEKVKNIIPSSLGFLSCLYGSCNDGDGMNRSRCELVLNMKNEKRNHTVDYFLQGFWCSKCDKTVQLNSESCSKVIHPPDMHNRETSLDCDFAHLQSLFLELLYDESSEEVQVACCVEYLLLNGKKAVRDAFCTQISSFLEDSFLSCLFTDEDASSNSKEQEFFNIKKHAFSETKDAQIFETLLESTAEIMMRLKASKLIQKSFYFHLKGGFELILWKVVHVRNELFDYLSVRLSSHPIMVKEFTESVLGIATEELIRKMIPVVLPKLVVSQQDDDQALETLYELAKCLNTDLVPLIVNWLPKVLAFALHRADARELVVALQFYHTQTGSDKQEIFAAALPAPLDELICFLDGGDSDKINRRLARVPEIIKEVARVLTGGEDLPSFLRSHFVGLLNSIDRKMLHAEDILLHKQALQSIEMLIKMMGSHLTNYVPKLMVLLMHAIGKEALQSEGLSVLHFFIVQLVKVSPDSTKHVISQQHIREFPPLPSISALTEVNKAIQEVRGSITLKDRLCDVVDGLNHESLTVRYMPKQEEFTSLITAEGGTDMDLLSSLITSLLRGCAEESRTAVGQQLKLVCADCLGALGAVDPAKLKGFSCQRFKIECSDDYFIHELIHKHLATAFRAAPDTVIQDSAALAIQELLKIAGCEASLDENADSSTSETPRGKEPLNVAASGIMSTDGSIQMNRRGQRLWDRFSNYVKEIIAPCLTSRFQLPNFADSSFIGPIYRPSMSFRRWIFSWIRKLTSHATGPCSSIFNACRGVVCHDMQTTIYLLPYLVLNAVCHATEGACHGITKEILRVLGVAASDNSGDAAHGVKGGKIEVCIQAVFPLLDNLGQWVDDTKQELALSQASQSLASKQLASKTKDQTRNSSADQEHLLVQCKYVSELLSAIPKVTLARASFSARLMQGSFNPASDKSGIFDDENISYLMEIYSCLDEPDGLSGFACLRKSMGLQIVGCMQGVQAAWMLGRWDLMDEYLSGADEEGLLCSSSESNASFDMEVAKILQAMMKKDQFSVAEKIALSKQVLIAPLAATGMDSYVRAYPFVVKLHLLREIEDFHSLLVDESFLEKSFQLGDHGFSQLMENWKTVSGLHSHHSGQDSHFWPSADWFLLPVLWELKLGTAGFNMQSSAAWLLKLQVDLMFTLEKAKLPWSTRRSDGAIARLQQSLLNMPVEIVVCDTQALNENRDIAKTLLLYTRWIQHTRQKQKEDVLSQVGEGYFYSAKYCEELLADARKCQEENIELGARKMPSNSAIVGFPNLSTEKPWWSYVPDVLLFYAKGLFKGHKNLFQALPRLLTLWFAFGSMYLTSGTASILPQLVFRICHQNEEVVRLVKNIITTVLRQYPQQGLWIMAAVSKSTVPSRQEAAAEILQAARKGFSQGNTGSNLFVRFASLIDHLIKLCFHPGQSKAKASNISTEFGALKRMMPLGIIMPIQQSLTISLPTYDGKLSDSLRIVLLGSDGIERPLLYKPKDDLRKDARMMEFTAMINCLLSKYPESRLRKLYICTFAVIPLTEDCGMIEWVPHTRGLRHILQDIYINCGNFDRQKTNPHIKRIYDQCQGKIPEDVMLKDKILPMFPPVFHKWFLTIFSEPTAWFRVRIAYAHTTAVSSMVGHIVGLGDRHGENILFYSTTGDSVHVDFSCLFDKGLQVCEITVSVLRMHRETLMSVVETFVHDPLVEWTKSHNEQSVTLRQGCKD
ncbi:Ataxia telangiectasia-mutated and RAD3-related [Pyrus ussuriensis x Pyrus communis]|uniref:Serine/threonine-protein kinase ATR n=1 Tax=Pyrus ussuriensis x Pyrus communis TaxID=2448454 RepID=A0A5N5FLV4_9ROSA|nr:Ataxia telangiectasia-mutated and RAD3-related [Pyrus ussuriensis x Pyrus communis]